MKNKKPGWLKTFDWKKFLSPDKPFVWDKKNIRTVALFGVCAVGLTGVLIAGSYVYWVTRDLPGYDALAHYEPPITSRVYAGNGTLIGEYARERRIFVPLEAMPSRLAEAFVSAEDKTFWTHPGISVPDIVRAAATNAQNWGKKRPVGASTITQQVAKNLLLSNEVSFERKIKEALLSIRLEETLPKRRILELYLNLIEWGDGIWGCEAAAQSYFGVSAADLSPAQAARRSARTLAQRSGSLWYGA